MGAYRWLSDNYRENDKIYFFGKSRLDRCVSCCLRRPNILGFSRGAYQVRVLAGMIQTVRYSWFIYQSRCNELIGRANLQGK